MTAPRCSRLARPAPPAAAVQPGCRSGRLTAATAHARRAAGPAPLRPRRPRSQTRPPRRRQRQAAGGAARRPPAPPAQPRSHSAAAARLQSGWCQTRRRRCHCCQSPAAAAGKRQSVCVAQAVGCQGARAARLFGLFGLGPQQRLDLRQQRRHGHVHLHINARTLSGTPADMQCSRLGHRPHRLVPGPGDAEDRLLLLLLASAARCCSSSQQAPPLVLPQQACAPGCSHIGCAEAPAGRRAPLRARCCRRGRRVHGCQRALLLQRAGLLCKVRAMGRANECRLVLRASDWPCHLSPGRAAGARLLERARRSCSAPATPQRALPSCSCVHELVPPPAPPARSRQQQEQQHTGKQPPAGPAGMVKRRKQAAEAAAEQEDGPGPSGAGADDPLSGVVYVGCVRRAASGGR